MSTLQIEKYIAKLSTEDGIKESVLEEKLQKSILKILRNNHSYIFQLLYKYDVSESKAQQAFKQINDEDIALALAKLFIEREKQKIYFRKLYSSTTNNEG